MGAADAALFRSLALHADVRRAGAVLPHLDDVERRHQARVVPAQRLDAFCDGRADGPVIGQLSHPCDAQAATAATALLSGRTWPAPCRQAHAQSSCCRSCTCEMLLGARSDRVKPRAEMRRSKSTGFHSTAAGA